MCVALLLYESDLFLVCSAGVVLYLNLLSSSELLTSMLLCLFSLTILSVIFLFLFDYFVVTSYSSMPPGH